MIYYKSAKNVAIVGELGDRRDESQRIYVGWQQHLGPLCGEKRSDAHTYEKRLVT